MGLSDFSKGNLFSNKSFIKFDLLSNYTGGYVAFKVPAGTTPTIRFIAYTTAGAVQPFTIYEGCTYNNYSAKTGIVNRNRASTDTPLCEIATVTFTAQGTDLLGGMILMDGTLKLKENTQYAFLPGGTATVFSIEWTESVLDEVLTKLGTPVGASVSADIASVYSAIAGAGPVATVPTNSSSVLTGVVTTGTYADTASLNGTVWGIRGNGAGAPASVELTFVTGSTVNKANKVDIYGYLNIANPVGTKAAEVYAWNYSTGAYEQISTSTAGANFHIAGQTGTTVTKYEYLLNSTHIDPATGSAKIKITANDNTATTILGLDWTPYYYQSGGNSLSEIASAVWQSAPYVKYNGAITIDTVNGFAGTDLGVHGLPNHGSNNMANALTLASALGVRRFYCLTESEIELTQTFEGWIFDGWEFYVDLAGQTLGDTSFKNCHVWGTGTCAEGSDMHFDACYIASDDAGWTLASLCNAVARKCILGGTITLSDGVNIFDECIDGTDSNTEAVIVMSAGAEAQFRKFSGALHFQQMQAGNDILVDGRGRVVVNSNCTGGKITIRGEFASVVDEGGSPYSGDVEIVQTERISINNPPTNMALQDTALISQRLDRYSIEYDFSTYSKAVLLFYAENRPFTGNPAYWCYVYNSTGGKPTQSSEIVKRDIVNDYLVLKPV